MRKHRKIGTTKDPAQAMPAFDDDPARDDPHDVIEQELLGIWLSISRLREMILDGPPAADGLIIPLQRQAAPKKATAKPAPRKPIHRKPRRKAA